jgi:hypothetical protein
MKSSNCDIFYHEEHEGRENKKYFFLRVLLGS